MDSRVSNIKQSSLMDRNLNKHVTETNEKVKLRKEFHMHNDIAFSILSKLCIKSLKRFECVCKSWSLLFDNPTFMNMYRHFFLTKEHPYYHHTSLLLIGKFTPLEVSYQEEIFELFSISGDTFEIKVKYDLPISSVYALFEQNENNYVPNFNTLGRGSVNGILCLLPSYKHNRVVLWNPSINDFKVVRPSFVSVDHYYRGFGYDRHTDDYKVLCHGQIFGMKDIWEIYSLRANSWRVLINLNVHHMIMDEQQLYMDGLSHWMCMSERLDETYLMSFDWSNEVFIMTPVPSNIYGYFTPLVWRHLVLLKGSVALILNFRETATFHILVLGEVNVKESWTKMFIVGPNPCLKSPIGEGKKGDMIFIKKDGGLVSVNLNTQTIEDDLGFKTNRFPCKILIHRENLIPFEGKSI